ncbi:MAG: nucleotidyltransferase domain-containing protein [Anaerolineales bacterium]|nr:nucleotidyltransferase domain-containing protein [Anaerolineales bacterium]
MLAEDVIHSLTTQIVRRSNPERIILFGSQARGDVRASSDIDLLVVLTETNDKRQAAIEIRRALAQFPFAKDVIVTTPEEIARRGNLVGSVLRSALREGKVIYERG